MENYIVKRAVLTLFVLIYALAIGFSHTNFLPEQEYVPFYGYAYFDWYDFFLIFILLSSASFLLPVNMEYPSTLFVVLTFLILYIPSIVIMTGEQISLDLSHFGLLIAIWIGFLKLSFIVNLSQKNNKKNTNYINGNIQKYSLLIWLFLLIVLVLEFRNVMSVSDLSEVYKQRILGKANTIFLGYAQVYFGYFFSAIMFSYGLHEKNYLYCSLGVVGCFVLYLITAERTAFLLPFYILAFHIWSKHSKYSYYILIMVLIVLSSIIFLVSLFYKENQFFYEIGFYFYNRIIALPGLFILKYYDFFSVSGFTNWSHVKGLNLFFEPDPKLLTYAEFPSLGELFAVHAQGINSNSNASFLATDGVAAAGSIGVLVIFICLALYLYVVDLLSRKWNPNFIIPAMSPLPLMLTNGSFFTVLLSFGGIAWVVIFIFPRFQKLKLQNIK